MTSLQERFEKLVAESKFMPIFVDQVQTNAENHITYRWDGLIICHIVELPGQFVDDGDILRSTPASEIVKGGMRFDTLEDLVANIERTF